MANTQANGTTVAQLSEAEKQAMIEKYLKENAELKGSATSVDDRMAKLERENAALRAQIAGEKKVFPLRFKVGQAGGVSVYGLGRFPVTLYKEQWERILEADTIAQLKAFLKENEKQ